MHCKIRRYFRHGTLTQFRVFDAIVRLGSFTRAAEALHMAQPTASVHMKKLAETIGMPLFEQHGKRMQLTTAGEKLYAACQQIFETIYELDAVLAHPGAADACKSNAPKTPGTSQLRRAASFKGVCRRS